MKTGIHKFFLIVVMGLATVGLSLGVFAADSVFAEFYIAGMGGYTAPNDLTNSKFDFGPLEGTRFDLELENSAMGGGKIGYYFPSWEWVGVGVETEGFFTWPNLKEQSAEGTGGRCSTCFVNEPAMEIQVITWAFNALLRYPGKRIQPYVGAGLGVYFAELGSRSRSDNWVPGINLLAGVRGFITDHIALFAEYKYNRATLNLDRFEGDYSANIGAGGISFHFNVDPL